MENELNGTAEISGGNLGVPGADGGGNVGGAGDALDPGTAQPPKRGRGRPAGPGKSTGAGKPAGAGSGAGPGAVAAPQNRKAMDLGSLANSLVGIHAMMAMGLNMPELVISEEDGKRLAGPIIELQKHYKVPFDPKWVAWFQLCTAGAAIYLPRVVHASKRLQAQKATPARPKATPQNPTAGLVDVPISHAEEEAPIDPNLPPGFKINLGGA